MTNADAHTQEHGCGRFQTSSINRRCDRYFGSVAKCRGMIVPGAEFFNTEEQTADNKPHSYYVVCNECAKASAPVLRDRRSFSERHA